MWGVFEDGIDFFCLRYGLLLPDSTSCQEMYFLYCIAAYLISLKTNKIVIIIPTDLPTSLV